MRYPVAICVTGEHIRNLELAINTQKDAYKEFTALNLGRLRAPNHGTSANGLTEEDLAVCRSMGITAEEFLANKLH